MPPFPARARVGPVLWALAGVTLLATCAEPVYQDYTQRFPIGTQPETVNLPAHYASNADPFGGAAAESFDTLVDAYLDRGHGPITISGRAPAPRGNSPVPARMQLLRKKLITAGVPASAIRLQLASEGEPDTITLSYEQAVSGTANAVSLSYQLSQRFSVVARAGTENTLDLVFSIPFD